MAEEILDYEEERMKQAEIAMNMVLHAGDARNWIMEALEAIGDYDFEAAKEKLQQASEEMHQAHVYQTEVIQAEAGGKEYEYSILFCHAQDTLMTICTEYNLAKKLLHMFEKLDKRLSVLENK